MCRKGSYVRDKSFFLLSKTSLFTASAAPSAYGTSSDGEVRHQCFFPLKNSAALYKLCAAPSLHITHHSLHIAFPGYRLLVTSYYSPND